MAPHRSRQKASHLLQREQRFGQAFPSVGSEAVDCKNRLQDSLKRANMSFPLEVDAVDIDSSTAKDESGSADGC